MKLRPVVAGQFYPAEPQVLTRSFGAMESQYSPVVLKGEVLALLLPHAGYVYSGALAALGYRSLNTSFETVVVAGPSHFMPFKGVSLFAGEAVETPLGDIPVDQEGARFLMESQPDIAEIPAAFREEHSVEVHFPLVKQYLPRTKVIPIVMGQGMKQAVEPLFRGLKALFQRKPFLFVASSDLSHYPDADTAQKADGEFLEALLTGDEQIVEDCDRTIMDRGYQEYYCTHCGKEPVAALLKFARAMGVQERKLLAYRNSSHVTSDRKRVVGYAALAFMR